MSLRIMPATIEWAAMMARRIGLGVAALLIMAVAGGWFYIDQRRAQLELGVGYGARVACACRYIGNRPLGQCYKDFEPGMEVIQLADDPATKTVTASVPLVASRSVTFDPVLGCQAAPFRGTPLKVH
ncbi:hypothetical protein [Sphingomonas sp.]|uniref:hypothetical protein n=1 Tax=Sphingomonas sp. TaxID=28214 RepID=UPI001DBC76A7|nr:hypothetical protein [Sphingomonas sp.]MBX9797405.1 hypothetical protein [Sphingomonas sp.]